jgi:hypothetical protein
MKKAPGNPSAQNRKRARGPGSSPNRYPLIPLPLTDIGPHQSGRTHRSVSSSTPPTVSSHWERSPPIPPHFPLVNPQRNRRPLAPINSPLSPLRFPSSNSTREPPGCPDFSLMSAIAGSSKLQIPVKPGRSAAPFLHLSLSLFHAHVLTALVCLREPQNDDIALA